MLLSKRASINYCAVRPWSTAPLYIVTIHMESDEYWDKPPSGCRNLDFVPSILRKERGLVEGQPFGVK